MPEIKGDPAAARPETVTVYDPNREQVVDVPASQAKLLEDAGYKVGPAADYEAEVQGLPGKVASFMMGAANGGTFGQFQHLVPKSLRDVQQQVEAAHPVLHGVGEMATAAPMAAAAPGGIYGRVAASAAQGAGEQMAQAVKMNQPIAAERVLQGAGIGAFFGLAGEGLAAGIGAVVPTIRKGVDTAAKIWPRVESRAARTALKDLAEVRAPVVGDAPASVAGTGTEAAAAAGNEGISKELLDPRWHSPELKSRLAAIDAKFGAGEEKARAKAKQELLRYWSNLELPRKPYETNVSVNERHALWKTEKEWRAAPEADAQHVDGVTPELSDLAASAEKPTPPPLPKRLPDITEGSHDFATPFTPNEKVGANGEWPTSKAPGKYKRATSLEGLWALSQVPVAGKPLAAAAAGADRAVVAALNHLDTVHGALNTLQAGPMKAFATTMRVLTQGAPAVLPLAGKDIDKEYAEKSARVARAAGDPQGLQDWLHATYGQALREHPELQQQLAVRVQMAATVLNEHMPKDPGDPTIQSKAVNPPRSAKLEWLRQYHGIDKPLEALQNPTPGIVQTMEEVHPETVNLVRQALTAYAMSPAGQKMTPAQARRMSIIIGGAVRPQNTQGYVQRLAKTHQEAQAKSSAAQSSTSGTKPGTSLDATNPMKLMMGQ